VFKGKRAMLDLGIPGEKTENGALVASNGAWGMVLLEEILEPLFQENVRKRECRHQILPVFSPVSVFSPVFSCC